MSLELKNKKINERNNFVNIALLGCGRISKKHLIAISKNLNQCNLIALCDTNHKLLIEAHKYWISLIDEESKKGLAANVQLFSDYQEMLDDHRNGNLKIDLIVIATPSGLHAEQTIAASKMKIDICTEKPMATFWMDGLKMYDSCKKNDVKLFVVKQNRLNTTLQLLKKQIIEKRFGKIYLVTVNVFWNRLQQYYDSDEWRGTRVLDGGALMNQASHYVDILDWLIGPIQSLYASAATLARNIETEDTAVLNIKWKNGALGTMAVTMLTYPKNLEGSITILGEKGTVKIGGNAVNKVEHWEFQDKTKDDELIEDVSYQTSNVYGYGHIPYYKNMLDSINGKDEPICSGEEGLKSLEILEACYKSSKLNKKIDLPLESEI